MALRKFRTLAFVVYVLGFSLTAGCKEGGKEDVVQAAKPIVVCTTTMISDLARQIGNDRVQVVGIMKPGTDPHSYEPTPDDVIWFKKADLVLYNGLHLEGRLLDMIRNSGSKAVAVAEDTRIKLRSKAGAEGAPDPHCWWNVRYFMMYAERARDALIQVDKKSEQFYSERATDYIAKLEKVDGQIRDAIGRIPKEQRVLITSHDAFFYYGEAYGLKVDAVLGINTDAEVRALRANELAKMVTEARVPAVFHETSVSDALNRMINRVVEIAAGEGHTLHVAEEALYSDSLGPPKSPSGTYIGAILENTRIVSEALSGHAMSETAGRVKD